MHPSFRTGTGEALATGLIIAIIGIIAYYLYIVTAGKPGSEKKGEKHSSKEFWGMSASLFVVGALFAFLAEYAGMRRKFCVSNYGKTPA